MKPFCMSFAFIYIILVLILVCTGDSAGYEKISGALAGTLMISSPLFAYTGYKSFRFLIVKR